MRISMKEDQGIGYVERHEVIAGKIGPKWADVVGCLGGVGQASGLQLVNDSVSSRAKADIRSMGLTDDVVFNSNGKKQYSCNDGEEDVIKMVENERDLLWATKVDRGN
ncbi:hypothetical protein V6N11_083015 [Hibiscus sabdariffa]|uniref:Uncharacterized protein n=1 Tax=Hibiscus sabdariffa TaxID=183260 RepID=A0ABR2QKN2_9ROSI